MVELADTQVLRTCAFKKRPGSNPGGGITLIRRLKMLVLSRMKDESIIIGDDITITIVDVHGNKVRLGISAPRSISVHRKEIYDAIQKEKNEGKDD